MKVSGLFYSPADLPRGSLLYRLDRMLSEPHSQMGRCDGEEEIPCSCRE